METLTPGSAACKNGEEYMDEYSERISQFIATFNQDALLTCASAIRVNRPPVLSREFSLGNFNLYRKSMAMSWTT
ncbi:hypothetical protein N0V88_002282 [Collariella sp. IMI 366227]|nr:hypothetical protein N0V88_002282 [Collariella sp. IMI 366227]